MELRQKLQLKRFIQDLEKIRGRHTELVSVYIPQGYDLVKVIQHLLEEQGTAKNIKDAKTRQNVVDSLERCVRHLRLFKQTPPNGLALFAGNVAAQEGKVDIQLFSVEPPEPVKTRLYRCDQTFVLDILRDQFEEKGFYGLIVMDRREATVGFLKGTSVQVKEHLTSGVPGKFKAGGQCQLPDTLVTLADNSQIKIEDCGISLCVKSFDLGCEEVKESVVVDKWSVVKDEAYRIVTDKGLEVVCSADHVLFVRTEEGMKEEVVKGLCEGDLLLHARMNRRRYGLVPVRIKSIEKIKKRVRMVDIAVENGNFIANGILSHNSAARFERLREGMAIEFYKRISEVCNKEFLGVKELKGVLLGGPGPTKEEFSEYLNNEIRRKIVAVQDLTYTDEQGLQYLVEKSREVLAKEVIIEEKRIMERFFSLLGKEPEKVTYGEKQVREALKMGAVEVVLLSESVDVRVIEDVEKEASLFGSGLQLISVETQEGQQLKDLGGVAAILRYAVRME